MRVVFHKLHHMVTFMLVNVLVTQRLFSTQSQEFLMVQESKKAGDERKSSAKNGAYSSDSQKILLALLFSDFCLSRSRFCFVLHNISKY